jgi:hypothetical protein
MSTYRARALLASAALLIAVLVVWLPSHSYYAATTGSSGNTANAAATYPIYQSSVSTSGPTYYHRSEDAASSGGNPALQDAIGGNANPGALWGASDGPRAWWRFNGDTSPTAQDFSGAVNNGTLTSSTTPGTLQAGTSFGTPALTGQALKLPGNSDYLSGPTGVIDSSTAYSASVWVYLTSTAADRRALALTGTDQSVFALGYATSCTCWELRTTLNDNATTTSYTVHSAASANTWTNLAVTVSGATVTFYVNGVSKGTVSGGTWAAASNLLAGAVKIDGALSGFWLGGIDEVRVYQRALSATELVAIAAHTPVAEWGFNEEQGGTSADLSGNGHTADVSNATWASPGDTGGALSFVNGGADYASASAVLNTQQSFSVSALVRLNATATAGVDGVVGQYNDTTINKSSGFILKWGTTMGGGGYRAFIFLMPTTNNGSSFVQVEATNGSASPGNWYWVTAVYDSSADSMKLYINGAVTGSTVTNSSPIASNGGFMVGRSMWGGFVDNMDGQIDAAYAYQYALSAAQVAALATVPPAFTAGVRGALQGAQQGQSSGTAIAYSGMSAGYNDYPFASTPNTFSLECWFKTTTGSGGEIIGFADKIPSAGVPTKSDRMVYLEDTGKLAFVVLPAAELHTTAAYNDGSWHHLVAEMGPAATTGFAGVNEPAGMRLYVDGALVASNTTTSGTTYAGYVRWGGSRVSGWTTTPTTPQFEGLIDEVAVYSTQLTHQDVAWHYYADH